MGQLLGFSLLTLGSDFGESLLECRPLLTELGDPLRDQLGLDPLLRGLDLRLDLAVELGDLVADSRAGELAFLALLACVRTQLLLEALDTERPEDPLLKETG